MKKQRTQRDLYQEITDRIVERLEAGDIPPWRQPIRGATGDPFPKNLSTGKSYRGINVWLLSLTSWTEGYGSRYWMTFRQAKELGGQVRKGERGSLVTFWKPYEKTDPTTDEKTILPVLKHYTVFNAEQIEGVTPPDTLTADPNEPPFLPIAQAQDIVDGFAGSPAIEHHGSRAAYFPQEDVVRIAPPERFETPEAYYGTLYHELTHATGHSRRLDRGLDTRLAPFGTPDYSKEELVAEMGAAFLCAVAGISPPMIEQSAAYLAGWLRQMKQDKKLIVQAAGHAQKAADLILGVTFNDAAKPVIEDREPPPPKPTSYRSQRTLDF